MKEILPDDHRVLFFGIRYDHFSSVRRRRVVSSSSSSYSTLSLSHQLIISNQETSSLYKITNQ